VFAPPACGPPSASSQSPGPCGPFGIPLAKRGRFRLRRETLVPSFRSPRSPLVKRVARERPPAALLGVRELRADGPRWREVASVPELPPACPVPPNPPYFFPPHAVSPLAVLAGRFPMLHSLIDSPSRPAAPAFFVALVL